MVFGATGSSKSRASSFGVIFGRFTGGGIRRLMYVGAAVLVACLFGLLIVMSVKVAAVFALAFLFVVVLLIVPSVQWLFFADLAFSLFGYAFSGKPFAYLGVRPIYLDEVVLLLAAITIATVARHARLSAIHGLLLLFMSLGALRTIPYISTYGINALRDGVLWAYGFIAIAVSFTVRPEHMRWITSNYRKALPYFLVWAPCELLILSLLRGALPNLPGTNVPIIVVKGGDLAISLVGAGGFLLVGLYAEQRGSSVREGFLWFFWVLSLMITSALSRGAFLASAASMGVAFLLRPSFKVAFFTSMTVLVLLLGLFVLPDVQIRGDRQVSVRQLVLNTTSIVTGDGNANLETTKDWRLAWWTKIVHYTVFGPYFWTGKGFGVNLADDDGFQISSDHSLRAPHNSHMSVLARMGVPGFAIWIALQSLFGVSLFRACRQAWSRHDGYWFQVDAWLLACWFAIIIASSFDLYLEGPQVGVWFWVVFGLGITAIQFQDKPVAAPVSEAQRRWRVGVSAGASGQ